MATKTAVAAPVPEAFYREVIDLNRYSNSVASKYARAYNDIIARAAERLVDIEFRQQGVINAVAPETRKRLRAIIKQSKDSLNTWSGESARAFKKELQGLAVLQTEFIEDELKKVVASGNIPINSVAVSTGFGDAVVSTDPTRLNLFGRPEEEFKKFKAGDFALTTRRGELLTLPNGETVEKAFRGIAARSSERLGGAIRQGVLSGETNVQIARRLMGRLNFNEYAKEGTRAFALAGNQPLKLANNQIKTIVRTSINQVSNAASQSVYAANKDVAPEYEYVATLDSRTSSICQRLDGQKFGYDKGPTPPQHFNCRSTTVPVVDYEGLGLTPPPETKITTRPSETGRVPQKVSYGDWLYEQRARGANDKLLKYEPGELQIKTLGFEKAKYFNRLAAKSNGKDALRQVIRSDGTELTLEQLKKKYGKPIDIKAAKKATPKVKTLTNTQPTTETWQPTSDFKEGIKRGESMTKGRFEKTKELSTKYKKAFTEYQEAQENYFTYRFDNVYKAGVTYDEAAQIYKRENIARKAKWLSKKEAMQKIEKQGAKEMGVLRVELLKTNVSDNAIKESLDKIPFVNKTKELQKGVRKDIEEFAKMFNGGGVTIKPERLSSGGQITKVKLGTSRAYNSLGEILVPFGDPTNVAKTLKAKQTIFHEVGHSLEKITNKNLDMSVGWRSSRVTSNIPTKAKTKVKRAWTLKEKVLPDEFIDPYVGRPYYQFGIDRATEVVSMGVEHFATPELMFRLYTIDPDHFHMILSLTRNVY